MSHSVRNMNQMFTQAPSHSIHKEGRSSTPRTTTPDHANNELNKRAMTDKEKNKENTSNFLVEAGNRASPDQNTGQLRVDDKPGIHRRNSAPDCYSITSLDELGSRDLGRRLSYPGAEKSKIQEQHRSLPGHKQSNQDESAATQELGKKGVNKSAAFAKQMTDQPRPAIQSGAAQEEESISSVRTTLLPGSLNTKGPKSLQGGGDIETVPQQEQANYADSVYISPGNHNEEYYRLSTFGKYPSKAKAKCTDIAAAGFYYTGIGDKVTCFRCGISVENWVTGVDGMDKTWHKSDCRLITGEDTDNKPLPTPNYRTALRAHNELPNSYLGDVASQQIHSKNSAPDAESLPNIVISTKESSPAHGISTIPLHEDTLNESNYSVSKLVSDYDHKLLLQSLDLRKEKDRRITFSKWPADLAQSSPCDFAKKGFVYLGYDDHIQCFCCFGCLQNWPSTDGKFEQERLHLSECKMSQDLDSGNIPLADEERRNADKTGLAETIENGVTSDFESGNISMTNIQSPVADEPNLVRRNEVCLTGRNEEPPDPSIEEQQQLAVDFPCSRPINPHMESLEARITSFDSRWPETVHVTKEHLAKAGFYFDGENDRVVCFYCNGDIENWEEEDEPWTEHAKWFPECEYVLRSRGVKFVQRLEEGKPNLNNPYMPTPVSYDARVQSANENTTSMERNNYILIDVGFLQEEIDNAIQRLGTLDSPLMDIIINILENIRPLSEPPCLLETGETEHEE